MKTHTKMKCASLAGGFIALALLVAACGTHDDSPSADVVLKNGRFYTPNETTGEAAYVTAIAVKDGVIVEVGAAAEAYKADRVIDLAGATVIPGLHDDHVHAIGSGQAHLLCNFPQGSPGSVVQAAVAACVAQKEPGEWITGGQWESVSLGAGNLNKEFLDAVSPNNPVALNDISMHAILVNSRALELAGITRDTPNPEDGVIEKDPVTGEPTGVLREAAARSISALVPPATDAEIQEGFKWARDQMLQYGITSYTEAATDENGLKLLSSLADQNELKLRVRTCISHGLTEAVAKRDSYARADRLQPDCIKIVLDGVPTEGHTAAMLEPYEGFAADHHDHAMAYGLLMIPGPELNATLTAYDKQGLTVKMHAAGDAAVRAGLDAIAAARAANGNSGLFHNTAHNSFISTEDLARAASINATFEMSPYIWYDNPIVWGIIPQVGNERMKKWTPVNSAIASGALTVVGSDWAVIPSVNPWIAIETLVTRKPPGGKHVITGEEVTEELGGDEKVTLTQAIELFTVNAARALGKSDKLGKIKKGMLADFVVLDRNPFDIPANQIAQTRVKQTYIGGEVVYQTPTGN